MSDFTLAPKQIIVDLINTDNPDLSLTIDEITFGVPAVETGERNTSVILTATEGGRFTGTRTIFYDRLAIDAVFTTGDTEFIKDENLNSNVAVINAVNTRFGINLTDDDYTISDFPEWGTTPGESHQITITAKPGSLVWTGEGYVTLKMPTVDLADAITVNTLNGLNYTAPPAGP